MKKLSEILIFCQSKYSPDLEINSTCWDFKHNAKGGNMGKILSVSLDKLDDPIFDSPYEIFTPKRFSSKEKVKKKPNDEKLNKKNKVKK